MKEMNHFVLGKGLFFSPIPGRFIFLKQALKVIYCVLVVRVMTTISHKIFETNSSFHVK